MEVAPIRARQSRRFIGGFRGFREADEQLLGDPQGVCLAEHGLPGRHGRAGASAVNGGSQGIEGLVRQCFAGEGRAQAAGQIEAMAGTTVLAHHAHQFTLPGSVGAWAWAPLAASSASPSSGIHRRRPWRVVNRAREGRRDNRDAMEGCSPHWPDMS